MFKGFMRLAVDKWGKCSVMIVVSCFTTYVTSLIEITQDLSNPRTIKLITKSIQNTIYQQ